MLGGVRAVRHNRDMSNISRDPRCVPVPALIRKRAVRLIREYGPREAARLLGVSRDTAISAALGLDLMPGTVALMREAIASGGAA